MEPHKKWWKEAGVDTPVIHYCQPFGKHSIMVLDADIVKEILFARYGENPQYIKKLYGLIPLIGKGLVTLEGSDWQRHRRIIHPYFQPNLIRESLAEVVPKLVTKFISYWKKCADGKHEIDVCSHLSNLTLDIIGDAAFSHDFHALDSIEKWANANSSIDINSQNHDRTNGSGGGSCGESKTSSSNNDDELVPVSDKIVTSMKAMFSNSSRRIILMILNLSVLDYRTANTGRLMDQAVEEVITEARRKLEINRIAAKNESTSNSNGASSSTKSTTNPRECGRLSLLQRLLDAEDSSHDNNKKSARKSLDDHELRDEVKTFILAGHETTSTWCYWAIFALCKYPDIQEKVCQDIMKHCCPSSSSSSSEGIGSIITIEMIENMKYFNAFMKEVLRLYPPAGMIIRTPVKDEKIKKNGMIIPAETKILIPIHLLHRHPLYWKDPELFSPERWLSDNGNGTSKVNNPSNNKYAYMPFSNGPRNCIGYNFAEMEAKLLMVPLIKQFVFRLPRSLINTEFIFTTFITMKAKPDLKICIQSRS